MNKKQKTYKKHNKIRAEQLGMSYGTAAHRLRKQVLFQLLQKYNEDNCFQCGKRIEKVDDLSMEHKVPWLHSEDPVGLFFDLDNIAFSHMSCNFGAARKPTKGTAQSAKVLRFKKAKYMRDKYTTESRREKYQRTGY